MRRVAQWRYGGGQQVKRAGGPEHGYGRHKRDKRGQNAQSYGYALLSAFDKKIENIFTFNQPGAYNKKNYQWNDITAK
jgi:hypothetical protein